MVQTNIPPRYSTYDVAPSKGNGLVAGIKTIPSESERTDHSRWRLLDERGRQTWHYLESDEELNNWPQSVADKYHLGLATVKCPFLVQNSAQC